MEFDQIANIPQFFFLEILHVYVSLNIMWLIGFTICCRPVWAKLDISNKDLKKIWWPAEDAGLYKDGRRQVYSHADDEV